MKLNVNDYPKQEVNGLRGGEGIVYLQKMPTLVNMKMYAKITIPKGSSIGIHTHVEDEEVIYVLKNKGILTIDGKEMEITEGMVSLCKKGRNHSIKNIFDDDLELLAVVNE